MLHTDMTPDAFCIEIERFNNPSDFVEDQNCISETIKDLLDQRHNISTNSSYHQKAIEVLNQKLEAKITKKSTQYLNGILGIHKQQYSRIKKEIETLLKKPCNKKSL